MTNEQNKTAGISTFCDLVETLCNTNSRLKLVEHINRLSTKEKNDVLAYTGAKNDAALIFRIRNYVENYLAR
jgi:hypothetical protein